MSGNFKCVFLKSKKSVKKKTNLLKSIRKNFTSVGNMRTHECNFYRQPGSPHTDRKSEREHISKNQLTKNYLS